MNFKLNTLVAALVLAASAMSANAAIDNGLQNSNSEVIFSAWDANAGIGYTYDLNWGLVLNNLVGVDQAATATGNALLATNARVNASLIATNGIIFDDVLTGFNTANFANFNDVQWNVASWDASGRNRLLITAGDSGLLTPTSNNVRAATTIINAYAPSSNDFIITPADDTFAVTASTNGNAYAGNAGSGYDGQLSDTTSILGQSANLVLLAQASQVAAQGAQSAFVQQLLAFDGREVIARTYLQDNQWRLQIAAVTVAAVPEPETYAMLLAGLGLVGGIARRRNKTA